MKDCTHKPCEYLNTLCSFAHTYVLVGNHDKNDNQQYLNTEHWLNCLKTNSKLTIVDKVIVETIEGSVYTFAPFVPDGRFIEALNSQKRKWESSLVIFAHQTFDGAKMGAIVSENVEQWQSNFPLCVSGHIHQSQWIGNNLYYTGSCMQHSFGDNDKKTLALIEDNKVSTIDLELPTKKMIYLDADEIDDFDCKNLVKENVEFKVVVTGDSDVFKSFQKSTKFRDVQKLAKVVFKSKIADVEAKRELFETSKQNQVALKSFKNTLSEVVIETGNIDLCKLFDKLVYNNTTVTRPNPNLESVIIFEN